MLLAEDLLLLTLHARTGRRMVANVVTALAGAVLIELADMGLVDVDRPVRGRIVIHPAPKPTHPMLTTALDKVRSKEGRRVRDVLRPLGRGLRAQLADSLVNARFVRRREHRVLGVFPVIHLPVLEVEYHSSLRDHVRAVLLDDVEPDEHLCTLISLLTSLNAVATVINAAVPDPRAATRAAERRAAEITKTEWRASALSMDVGLQIAGGRSAA
jgi:hypothetical protein